MILDGGAVDSADTALLGGWDLDQPEREFIRQSGMHAGVNAIGRALEGTDAVYVAVDADGLDENEVAAFMPVPGGIPVADAAESLRWIAANAMVAGVGLAGFLADPRNLEPASRLCAAVGL
jgi:hypothetical protein